MLNNLLRKAFWFGQQERTKRQSKAPKSARLGFEQLEDRDCPSSFTMLYNGSVQSYPDLPAYNNFQQVNLGGTSANDILLTYRGSINGITANSPSITLIDPSQQKAHTFTISPWTAEVQAGTDVVFVGGSQITTLSAAGLTSSPNSSAFNTIQAVNLGGADSEDVLLTAKISFFGTVSNSPVVTLFNPTTGKEQSYNVGGWNTITTVGSSIVFNDIGTLGADHLTTISPAGMHTYANLPSFNGIQQITLGTVTSDLLLTYQGRVNGITANSDSVTVIDPSQQNAHGYTIKSWTAYVQAGTDVVFVGSQISTLSAAGLSSAPNSSAFNAIQAVNLGGADSDDVLLTAKTSFDGLVTNSPVVTLFNQTTGKELSYNVGGWKSITTAGNSIVFNDIGTLGADQLTTINSAGIHTYAKLPIFNGIQQITLGTVTTDLLLTYQGRVNGVTANSDSVTLIDPNQEKTQPFTIHSWIAYVQAGTDVVFVGSQISTLSTTGLSSMPNSSAFNTIQAVNLGGTDSDDVLLTSKTSFFGIVSNSPVVTLFNPTTGKEQTYNVGGWSSVIQIGNSLMFSLDTEFGERQTVVMLSAVGISTYQIGPWTGYVLDGSNVGFSDNVIIV